MRTDLAPINDKVCKFCGTPLGDVHGLRKFCPTTIDEDGSINSCKDDYHNAKKKPMREATKGLMKIHYANFLILDRLYNLGKKIVTKSELEREGLQTEYYVVRTKIDGTNEFGIYYIGYVLKEESQTQIQILKHGFKF